jgi:hypothetical protein
MTASQKFGVSRKIKAAPPPLIYARRLCLERLPLSRLDELQKMALRTPNTDRSAMAMIATTIQPMALNMLSLP